MAIHRRHNSSAPRKVAAASAALTGAAALMVPTTAQAAEVRVPNTPIAVEIPGIENVPGIGAIPGIQQWIPSVQPIQSGDIRSAVQTVKQIAAPWNIPGFNAFIAQVEAYLPEPVDYSATAPAAAPASAPAPAPEPVAQQQSSVGQQIVDIARSKIGSPYMYGAAGPDAFDCSGFTSWVYQQVGKSIPRTSQAQAAAGQPVAMSDIQTGDIVAYYGGASHVGIYVGNGMIIDALNEGTPVGEHPIDWMPIHSVVRF